MPHSAIKIIIKAPYPKQPPQLQSTLQTSSTHPTHTLRHLQKNSPHIHHSHQANEKTFENLFISLQLGQLDSTCASSTGASHMTGCSPWMSPPSAHTQSTATEEPSDFRGQWRPCVQGRWGKQQVRMNTQMFSFF